MCWHGDACFAICLLQKHWFEPGAAHQFFFCDRPALRRLAVDWLDKYLQTSFASWLASAARIGRRLTN
ncbi:hypothetical protein CFRS1_v008547 [Colletotrichum fructicola]|nr:hypothetical protein CFRS1_v008547 [Colletotrichum fructicola]